MLGEKLPAGKGFDFFAAVCPVSGMKPGVDLALVFLIDGVVILELKYANCSPLGLIKNCVT